jgi:SAM-dependent methyltransferase
MASGAPPNRYGSIAAEIYDIDKPFGALRDTAFHLNALKGISGPILEPACGSGRTLVPLLEAGHQVSGFDPSPEMLERCQARCAAAGFAPDLRRQTFADFAFDRAFDVILVPVGSFTLIDTYDGALAALRRFHAHLTPGGRVMLDIAPLSGLSHSGADRRRWTTPNGDVLTLEGARVSTDWIAQRSETLYRYERWRDSRLVETQLEPMAQRFWGLQEFSLTLREAGFVDVAVTADFRPGRPVGAKAQFMTFEARKP